MKDFCLLLCAACLLASCRNSATNDVWSRYEYQITGPIGDGGIAFQQDTAQPSEPTASSGWLKHPDGGYSGVGPAKGLGPGWGI